MAVRVGPASPGWRRYLLMDTHWRYLAGRSGWQTWMSDENNADQFVLPPDVILVPGVEIDLERRRGLTFEEGDFVITRPGLRSRSKVLDAGSAQLLQLFRKPRTIVDAILEFARTRDVDPEDTLARAFPV